jgi:RNA polymerase sigma-70 factor (ECF subfamily)
MTDDDFADRLIAALPSLRRFALSLARQPDVADDLVQITVERALAAQDRHDPSTPLMAWLFRILRNAFIDMTRRTRTRGTETDIADAPEAASVDGPCATESRVMLDQTMAAMAHLPEDQRVILTLVCMEDLSYSEAAEVLDIPVGTVMSRLSRARRALAARLGMD